MSFAFASPAPAPSIQLPALPELDLPSARIFLVDDDPLFARHVQRLGVRLGVSVRCFHPDTDFSRLPLDGDFDAAIIDFDLGLLRGTQLSALYGETPVVLITGGDRARVESEAWPGAIRCCVAKHSGAVRILRTALELSRQAREVL